MKPVVRNIRTKDIYFYEGDNEFTNIRTGVSGKVSDAAASKTFGISPELTIVLNEYPLLSEFIRRCDLITEVQPNGDK